MVKVGLVGIGFMGYTHYQIHKKNPNVKIVALADYNPKKLAGDWSEIGGNLGDMSRGREDLTGIKTYRNPLDLVADPEVEMVDICLPTDLHMKVVLAALASGKHVFCEKPMARTTKEGTTIAQAAAKAKGCFMVGHCIRFWPEYEAAYTLVQSKKYGRLREVLLRRVANPPTHADQNWFMNGKRSGGALLDLHIHDIDFALYLCGKPKRVTAWGITGPSKAMDVVHASYEYSKTLHATIIGGWAYQKPFPFNMEFCLYLDKATIAYDMASGKPMTVYTDGQELTPELPAGGNGWERELAYFIDCVEQKRKPTIVTAKSSLESLKFVEVELKSIKTGRPVIVK